MRISDKGKEIVQRLFPVYTKQCMIIIGIISLVLILAGIFHEKEEQITGIKRPDFYDDNRQITVYADIGEEQRIPINLDVEPIKPTAQEAQHYLEEVNERWRAILDQYYEKQPMIAGALKVYSAINDQSIGVQVEGYWDTSQWINEDGWIDLSDWEEGDREFVYRSTWTYHEEQLSDSYSIKINRTQIAPTLEKEWYRRQIQNNWKEQMLHTEYLQQIELPEQEHVDYYTETEGQWGKKSLGILFLMVLLITVLSRNEKKEKEIQYKKDIQNHFMYMSQDMVMLYQSGATLYTALRLALIQRQPLLKKGTKQKEVIDKLCDMLNQEQTMRDVMVVFKEIFDFREGRSFSRLMIQGSYYGDHHLSEQLSRISQSMWDERIRRARKESEKASSKLMFPMLIIFIVIIMLTVIPTFLEVGQM